MRVNSINIAGMRNASFGKVVKINSEPALYDMYNPEIDPKTKSVIDVIEGKNTSAFDKDAANVLCNFLRSKIGDYNPEYGLEAAKIYGEVYVFTGKEAVAAHKVISDTPSNNAARLWSQVQLKKDLELSDIIGRAKYAGLYDEIDVDFDDNGKINILTYKNDINND